VAQIKKLVDENGVIFKANKILPDDKHRLQMLASLAELENNECYVHTEFPVTRLHKVKGVKQPIYRADIDKISGWRIHVQLKDGSVFLNDILTGEEHDNVVEIVKNRKGRDKNK